jgi:plasmid stabilization system protein ParE
MKSESRLVIYYRPIEGGVEVIRVVSGARDAERLFQAE